MSTSVFEVRSPVDGSVIASLPVHGKDEVASAVATSRAAQEGWARRDPTERATVMRRVARALGAQAEALAGTIRRETGKPLTEALAEVLVSVDLIRYYARVAPRWLAPHRVGTGWILTKRGAVEREPYGVIGGITPWNYPLILALDCVTPALFAGNGVVLKPSEFTPLTALALPGILEDAGVSPGLLQVVTGDGGTGRCLVEGGVDRVVFTGSTATGRRVMETAARSLTPVTLELGGKDPAIVLEDADLERAARGVVFGGFFNAGQTCISVERVYVHRAVYPGFVERVAELSRELRTGVGEDADVGPIITPPQLSIIERQVADALARGARALSGGQVDASGRIFPPTVLVDVDDTMDVLRHETFGPLLPVVVVEDEDDAVRRANDTGYGLFASVWTGSRSRGIRVARRLRAGGVSINDVLSHYGVPALPMGGVGESGFGRRRGLSALEDMTRTKTLFTDRFGLRREPWWFPYSPDSERLMRAALEWRSRGGLSGLAGTMRTLFGPGGTR